MADWWKKLLGKQRRDEPTRVEKGAVKAEEKARWLAANDAGNPFGVELLDLMVTQTVVAVSEDREVAARSVSWGPSVGDEIDAGAVTEQPAVECSIRLPIDGSLPRGLLFTPRSMDEKYVIAWRDGRVIAARSWTGVVEAVADARIDGSTLVIERIRAHEGSSLVTFGALPQAFEWLLRSHALRENLPFPVDEEGARMFEAVPLSAFSAFGKIIFCAAKAWSPPPPGRPLRSDGRLIKAVGVEPVEMSAVERAIATGEEVDAPSTHAGYTALHFAIVRGRADVVERLLAAGADPNRRADKSNFALGIAIVHAAPPEVFEVLEGAGAQLVAANDDGFTALHAAGEAGNAWAVRWLVERKHELEPRTNRGHTPLQIACALGHIEAAKMLVELGADVNASSPDGSALEIARREGRRDVVAWLSRA